MTLVRAVLACAVAALTADSFVGPAPVAAPGHPQLPSPCSLDAVDGRVARRTGTVTPLGARFDMEVDAFLIAVLSVYVAPDVGAWVLAIGAMRYAYVAAGWALPWLRRPTPPRYWAKVVAAVQGVVLAVAAAERAAHGRGRRSPSRSRSPCWWSRSAATCGGSGVIAARPPRCPLPARVSPARRSPPWRSTLVWLALVLPDRVQDLTPGALLRLPLEGIVLVALALVLPAGPRRWVASVFGLLLGLLVVVKVLDIGFEAVLDRRFSPVSDWVYFGPGIGVLADSIGRPAGGRRRRRWRCVLAVVLLVVLAARRREG